MPLRPFQIFFPFSAWRGLVRLWLEVIRAQPDHRAALRQLLTLHADTYLAMDRGAVDYGDGEHPKHRLTDYHDFFVSRIAVGERVLDVGCGIGSVARDIAQERDATVVGIDSSPWALDIARARFSHPRVTYLLADALDYTSETSFDVVILSNVVEHIGPRSAFLRALPERVGARRLLIRVPALNRHWTVPLARELGLPHFSDPDHEVEYLPDSLRDELAQSGWEMATPTLAWGEIWVEARLGVDRGWNGANL